VYAPGTEAATNPGFLRGRYQGQTASATLGPGVGLKNAMVGGAGGSIELQPVSIEGNNGLNLAAAMSMSLSRNANIAPSSSTAIALVIPDEVFGNDRPIGRLDWHYIAPGKPVQRFHRILQQPLARGLPERACIPKLGRGAGNHRTLA
jgi:Protein of unknown function (DUF992)